MCDNIEQSELCTYTGFGCFFPSKPIYIVGKTKTNLVLQHLAEATIKSPHLIHDFEAINKIPQRQHIKRKQMEKKELN